MSKPSRHAMEANSAPRLEYHSELAYKPPLPFAFSVEISMQYARLKALIKQEVDKNGQEIVSMPFELFRQLLVGALRAKRIFDEKYYLDSNPDVEDAVRKGEIESGETHYYQTGYFENKLPKKLIVDEKFYVFGHADIAEAVRSGAIEDAQQHFENHGYREGRLPFSGFTLF